MTAISAAGNAPPTGGIRRTSPLPDTALYSRLSAALPGTMAGPREPPLSRFSRVVITRPDIALDSPWQARHFSCRMATAAPVSAQIAELLKSRTPAETVKLNRIQNSLRLKTVRPGRSIQGTPGLSLAFLELVRLPRI